MAAETENPPAPSLGEMTAINVRSSPEFVRWVAEIAADQRISSAALIELALIDYAGRLGWDEDPPHRLGRRTALDPN